MNIGFWGDGTTPTPFAGLGLSGNESYAVAGRSALGVPADAQGAGVGVDGGLGMLSGFGFEGHYSLAQERQGSLTHDQQLELMNVLETEGMSDIDNFLSGRMGLGGGAGHGSGVEW